MFYSPTLGKPLSKDKEDEEEEIQKPAAPRSPFGSLGNLTKTTLTSDPLSSSHVNDDYFSLF